MNIQLLIIPGDFPVQGPIGPAPHAQGKSGDGCFFLKGSIAGKLGTGLEVVKTLKK
jgi:hypothetical protein